MNFNDLTLLSVGRLSQTNRFIAAAEGADPTLCHAVDKVDGVDGDFNKVAKHTMLYPTAAIAKGEWVMIDTSVTTNGMGRHIKKLTNESPLWVGVAEEAASAASTIQPIRICVAGKPGVDAVCANSISAGAVLAGSSTGGQAKAATAKDGEIVCGVTLVASGSLVSTDVRVIDKGWY